MSNKKAGLFESFATLSDQVNAIFLRVPHYFIMNSSSRCRDTSDTLLFLYGEKILYL